MDEKQMLEELKQMLEELEQVRTWTKNIDERCQRIIASLSNAREIMNGEKTKQSGKGRVTFTGTVTSYTDKGLCILANGKEAWTGKSKVYNNYDEKVGTPQEFVTDKWIYDKNWGEK